MSWVLCKLCGKSFFGYSFLFNRQTSRETCDDCHAAPKAEEFESNHCVRCPKCKHLIREDLWEYGLYSDRDDPVDVCCPQCDHDFEVEVQIEYTWTSPALIEEEGAT